MMYPETNRRPYAFDRGTRVEPNTSPDTTLGRRFTVIRTQTYGGGRKGADGKQRIPRRVVKESTEYEIISEVMMSQINKEFVWAKIHTGKNAGKETPYHIEDLP